MASASGSSADVKSFYALLGVEASATAEDIKKAFRQEIARYHPDKVQHLGTEFQELAAARAAQLTEAYRILMNAELRAAYDAQLAAAGETPAAAPPAQTSPTYSPPVNRSSREAAPATAPSQFVHERERRDAFIRRASLDRFRKTLDLEFGTYECPPVRGFELACISKPRLFPRRASLRLLARFVESLDGSAIAETIALAVRTGSVWTSDELCVFLLGAIVASPRELAEAIAEHRKKPPRGVSGRITVVPIDVREWNALIPQDAPPIARALATRLKSA